jgi:hypothetical protein
LYFLNFRKELDLLPTYAPYVGRGQNPREIVFEDRTRPHADNVGNGHDTTAAVGILQAIYGNDANKRIGNRIVKDVVCFHAEDYERLIELLKLDVYEPPVAQVCKITYFIILQINFNNLNFNFII